MERTESPIVERRAVFVNSPGGSPWWGDGGEIPGEWGVFWVGCGFFKRKQTLVMAVTECVFTIGETAFVNMVRRASKTSLLRAGRHEVAVERGSRS